MDNIIVQHLTGIIYDESAKSLVVSANLIELTTRQVEDEFCDFISQNLTFIEKIELHLTFSADYSNEEMILWQIAKNANVEIAYLKERIVFEEDGELLVNFKEQGFYHRLMASNALYSLAEDIFETFGEEVDFIIHEPEVEFAESEADFSARLEQIVADNLPEIAPVKKQKVAVNSTSDDIIFGKSIKGDVTPLNVTLNEGDRIIARGELISKDLRITREGSKSDILSMVISDHSDAIKAKLFVKKADSEALFTQLKKGSYYLVDGYMKFDNYEKTNILNLRSINKSFGKQSREDKSNRKRMELHIHTNMSAIDGVPSIKTYVETAKAWGHTGIGITDHAVVQAYPDAMKFQSDNFKINYGMEANIADDDVEIVKNLHDYDLKGEFIVFDIETTGFQPYHDGITEIGAIKVKDGAILDRFSQLINPEKPIPAKVVELTGITDSMVSDKPTIDQVLPRFLEYCGDAPLVAHNARFDIAFISEKARVNKLAFNPMVLDTLTLSRLILTDKGKHNLDTITKYLNISLDNHHRAVDDAIATAKVFIEFIERLAKLGVKTTTELEEYGRENLAFKYYNVSHITLYARNQAGIKSLYELVSDSHINHFHREPLIMKSDLIAKRENLLLGSGCDRSELFNACVYHQSDEQLAEQAEFYDYFEIQPAENHADLLEEGMVLSLTEVEEFNRRIINLAKSQNKLCIATSNARYLNRSDEIYRRMLRAGNKKRDAENQMPLYFRTTDEMLDSFAYLGKALAEEVVIDNTHKLSEMIDVVLPVPKETFPPVIEGSDQELRDICYGNAKRLYGEPVPEIVEKRLTRELDSIINNGYAVMYIIAQKLVAKSMQDGYLVGSRGSVGSSFAATMADITEVNPLPAHYRCPQCKYSEFNPDENIKIGADLPDADCPNCHIQMIKDGFDIPFETFLGFEGDKEPDIDLNFAGVYQAQAHNYTEELFGEGYTFKAGTIGTIAEKTAFGYAKNYREEKELPISPFEVERLAAGMVGVKRTTGQHPGGIMVVPDYKDIHDFTPIQYPANKVSSGVKTTHFDYHSISGKILKLDILGHEVPTTIRSLEDLTGLKYQKIPLDDADTLSLFTSTKALKILDENYPIDSGTLGIPEFGTYFVRGMLEETKPTTIEELVQISGLSHGTDVWMGNARDLVQNGTCSLKEVIGIRDNIMLYLIDKGLPKKDSFFITEKVRKGKGLTDEQEAQMREFNVPDWYIESCKKISYMFPKAHAAAYVMSSLRIAYYKVHYPIAYYCTYFSNKIDDFDADLVSRGQDVVYTEMQKIKGLEKRTAKEENSYALLESVLEMYARGFKCHKVDLYQSDAYKFIPLEDGILPPLQALKGVGEKAALSIATAAKNIEFMSITDIKSRGGADSVAIEAMRNHGILEGLPEDNQLSLEFFLK